MQNRRTLFAGKSDEYDRYRPTYPAAAISALRKYYGLSPDKTVADIGCGTGLLSELFLQNGNEVECIDPSSEMLDKARARLSRFPKAHYIERFAESTDLAEHSIDVITAGQAFHWFDAEKARIEFKRILKDNGIVVLVWNDRNDQPRTFNEEYERICKKFSPEYHGSGSSALDSNQISKFFTLPPTIYEFSNGQFLNLEGVLGRYGSASYSISGSNPDYTRMLAEFKQAFLKYQRNGFVQLRHITRMYVGSIK